MVFVPAHSLPFHEVVWCHAKHCSTRASDLPPSPPAEMVAGASRQRESPESTRHRAPTKGPHALTISAPPRRLGPGFVDDIERRLGRPPKTRKACLGYDCCIHRLARLRPQTGPNLLGTRCRRADHRRCGKEHAAHGIEVLFQISTGKRLDDHPGAIRVEHLQDMCGGTHRITHVMQAIEQCNEIVLRPVEILRRCDRELCARDHPRTLLSVSLRPPRAQSRRPTHAPTENPE